MEKIISDEDVLNKKEICQREGFVVLVVDDEPEYQKVFSMILEDEGYKVLTCSNGVEAMKVLKREEIHMVITDLRMPEMEGLELLRRIKSLDEDIGVIIATGYGSIESAIEAIKYGASGYFLKGGDVEGLLRDIERIASIRHLKFSNSILKEQVNNEGIFKDTKNEKVREVFEMCLKAANSDINVLILGESGVGKEIFAKYIHNQSRRCNNHFIPVNCSVFSEGTIESELFGHEKGAFTGAVGKRIGRFEEANFGTLFMDEIGDLLPEIQTKLLRALETKKIERVGSNRSIDLDIRLISATNKDIPVMLADGKFREDLFYRINTLTITIPPLRERREDIEPLIDFLLGRIQVDQKKAIPPMEEALKDFLLNYDYPGNIRELKNILERLVVLSDGDRLSLRDLSYYGETGHGDMHVDGSSLNGMTLKDARKRFEKDYIANILLLNKNNVTAAASVLGITTRQLWNKISEYKLR